MICTSGASGPALPPATIDASDVAVIDGVCRASSRPYRRWMLSTTAAISPGTPSHFRHSPTTSPPAVVTSGT